MNTLTEDIRIADAGGRRVGARGWAALVVLMLPVLLVSVDNTVLSFALPAIAKDVEPTSVQQLWIVDAYPLVLAGLLVTMGTLGDRFGRRRMLLIGATGFAVVSGLAAFASSAEALILARAAMGVFGAMLMPSTLSLLRGIFTDRDQRRLAIAIWATMFSAGSVLGPIVGGLLLEHFAWGAVFFVAVPVLIPLLVLAPVLVPESRDPNPGRIDPLSIVLSMATLIPIVYGIKEIAVHGVASIAPILFAVGVGFGVLFIGRQLRSDSPMLDMRLFRRRAFSGALVVNLLSVVTFIGFVLLVSQTLQLVLGLTPIDAGVALIPGAVASIVSGLVVVPIARRLSPRIIVPAALVFTAVGYGLVALTAIGESALVLVVAFALVGIGLGAAQTVAGDLILASVPPAKAGAASAVSETAFELGAVLGTSVLGGVLTSVYRSQFVVPAGVSPEASAAAQETLGGAMATAQTLPADLGAALHDAAVLAFEGGILATTALAFGLVVVAAVVGATTLGRNRAASGR